MRAGGRNAAGKIRAWLREPQDVQAAAPPELSSHSGSGMSHRAQASAMFSSVAALCQLRAFTTRVSQIMSCSARFCESNPAMMKPISNVSELRILAK